MQRSPNVHSFNIGSNTWVMSLALRDSAPAERCGVAQYFGQRETRSNNIPKEKITSSANRTD